MPIPSGHTYLLITDGAGKIHPRLLNSPDDKIARDVIIFSTDFRPNGHDSKVEKLDRFFCLKKYVEI